MRSQAHNRFLHERLTIQQLWEYGIVAEIKVSHGVCDFNLISSSLIIYFQPFTADFDRADIHELIAPDLLHQVIKGTFKDHLVTWVEEYLVRKHGKAGAKHRLDDIDLR